MLRQEDNVNHLKTDFSCEQSQSFSPRRGKTSVWAGAAFAATWSR